ncbi:hypothetical protein GCM10009416_17250 [Craurococcus roseus]|uniref:GtrA/DPMS transmembrane domain-containing protein n=1 Tax=Craurococcus roseus TaxID=77585 RepID=A0ABN1F0T5_9PROT
MRDAFQRHGHAPVMNAERRRWPGEIIRFGVVGAVGFVVDAGVLTLGLLAGAGPWLGRAISYVAAATTTFALNRSWTFRGADRSRPVTRDWGLFLAVNLVGFACNYGTYAALISGVPMMRDLPVLAVAAGSLAGMVGNFVLSRRYVFRSRYDGAAPVAE